MKLEFLTATIRLIFSPFKVQRRNNKREWHSVEKITAVVLHLSVHFCEQAPFTLPGWNEQCCTLVCRVRRGGGAELSSR